MGSMFTRPAAAPAPLRSRRTGRAVGAAIAVGLVVWAAGRRIDILVGLVALAVPFGLAERWRPLRAQAPAWRRRGAATDATGFVVDEVVAALGLAALLSVLLPPLDVLVPDRIPSWIGAQPGWVRWVEAFAISELCGYWGHRWSHEIPMLWRFHRVHHSAPELDWLAPNRRHPVDMVVARASTALPILALGFTAPAVLGVFALKRLQGLFVHANLDLRLGAIERVYVTPFFHHWHHSAEPGTWNKNYAGSLPVVDWLFGTLHLPDRWPAEVGCEAPVPDVGYVGRLLSPWRRDAQRAARAES